MASKARKPSTPQHELRVTLRDGTVHNFPVAEIPRYWASWAMRQLPGDTDFLGAKFSRTRIGERASEREDRPRAGRE